MISNVSENDNNITGGGTYVEKPKSGKELFNKTTSSSGSIPISASSNGVQSYGPGIVAPSGTPLPPPSGPSTTTHTITPATGAATKKDSKKSSLLASSRKAGSKVVKATVVRPARAVTRVFRGTSKASSEDSSYVAAPSSNAPGEESRNLDRPFERKYS